MGNFFAKLLEHDSDCTSELGPINSETESQVLNMENETINGDCTKVIETENCNRMTSKETLVLLDNEQKSMHGDSENHTENLNCKLPDLLQTEDSVPNISKRTQTECTINTRKLENTNTSTHASLDKQNEFPEQNISNVVSIGKGIKRANSNTITTKKPTKRAKSSPAIMTTSKDVNKKTVKLTSTFSTEFQLNRNSTILCMESLISRRRIIHKKRQEAREELSKMENRDLSNIRKQKKRKVRRSPRTKKLTPTFSSTYFFNPDSNIQCMESIIERRRFIFNKKQEELKKCKNDRKQKPKPNKRKVRKGKKLSKNQNNNMLHNKDKKIRYVQQSDMSYCSSCIYCNKNHEYRRANTRSSKQYKEKFTNTKKTGIQCAIM